MMERRQIVRLWREDPDGVLVTLVRIEGSSYRQPGARLLITPSSHAGTISGGCLESEVLRKAAWMVRDGSIVERYSTRFDDTAEIPYGLGCGGTVDLLLEPCHTAEAQALLRALEASLHGEGSRVVTWLPGEGRMMRRAVFSEDNQLIFASNDLTAAEISQSQAHPRDLTTDGIYSEHLAAPQRLIVFGAGDDARPLVSMAALLGWSVVVADGRGQFVTRERFPAAEQIAVLTEETSVTLRPEDAVVLMTHSYEQDRRLLIELLQQPTRYLGLLGARHRTSVLVSEAATILSRPLDECCARLHAPVGLDLGGDGPEAIALSVLAQVQAVLEGRDAGQRRLSAGEVAEQLERGGVSQLLRPQCS
jgi:xanthine/CO dehydrogenase XdhC/CoxF family maturation factor